MPCAFRGTVSRRAAKFGGHEGARAEGHGESEGDERLLQAEERGAD